MAQPTFARPTDTGSAGSIGSGVLPFPLVLTVSTQSVEAEDGSGALWEKSSGRGVVRVTLNGPDRPGERRGNVSRVRRSVLGFPESSAPMAGALMVLRGERVSEAVTRARTRWNRCYKTPR
jgi:hypothetical protein